MKLAAVTTPNNIVFLYVAAAAAAALLVYLGVRRLGRLDEARKHTRKLVVAFTVVIGLPLLGALAASDSTGVPLGLDDYGRQVVIGWAFSVPLFSLGLWFSAMRLMAVMFARPPARASEEERDA